VTRSIYITSIEGHAGKSTVALGMLDTLSHETGRVGVFRPVARSCNERDYVLEMLLAHDGVDLDYDECVGVSYDDVHADPEAALSEIVSRFKAVERQCDAVVILGSDYTDVGSPTELGFNARIAANLGAPVLLVLGGQQADAAGSRTPDDLRQVFTLARQELDSAHAHVLGVVINRADPKQMGSIIRAVEDESDRLPVWAIPEDRFLIAPSIASLMEAVEGTMIKGDPALLGRGSWRPCRWKTC
jgi:phosphate acetyltransferase